MIWQPSPKFCYALKMGMLGIDVWAIQINLVDVGRSVVMDGDFGPKTEAAVKLFQTQCGLEVDGIAGIMTQRAMILKLSASPSVHYRLPNGLLKSVASNESGFAIAAYSPHPSDSGFDIGPFQQAFPPMAQSETNYHNAYSSKWMAEDTAKMLRTKKDEFRSTKYVSTDKYAWQLAVLNHNWPAAAENLATKGSILDDPVRDYQPAQWVIDASGGRLSTPRQWVDHYIAAATVFVTTWPA